ncbi:hypothetical protein TeGR_g12377 [Tetraparma gracilis]|uniref:AAA+ ATPase domain-containing protein n=1 Tax=Tetraparma gracilis TaxID=2962635 RepID=A0ABQ6MME3_9STRA|nr:hypothetical protein TeGR_g12377 [Tetraparma gracilis]
MQTADEKKTGDSWTLAPTPSDPTVMVRAAPLSSTSTSALLSHLNRPSDYLSAASYCEFTAANPLYDLLLTYLSEPESIVSGVNSFLPEKTSSSAAQKKCCGKSPSNPNGDCKPTRTSMGVGLGILTLRHEDTDFHIVHEALDHVVATDCEGATFYKHLVIVSPTGASDKIQNLCDMLIEREEKLEPNKIKLFHWHVRHQYWRRKAVIAGRHLDSVILPEKTKTKLLADVDDFLSDETKEFYASHGVPWRRSYLFHGAPGAGKTSLVQALATQTKRSICFMQPTHPEMTDEDLQSGVSSAPANSIIVLEDIDSLFTQSRDNRNSKSALTFTGLLNALDGVGSASGQIIVLTTNFREKLDAALIRNGRVDVQIEFSTVDESQCEGMFLAYYAGEEDCAKRFAKELVKGLKERGEGVASAALQHFFVQNRNSTAEQCCKNVDMVWEEIKSRKEEAEKGGGKKKEGEEEDEEEEDEEEEEGEGEGEGGDRGGGRGRGGGGQGDDKPPGWDVDSLIKMSLVTGNLALVSATAMVLCSALKAYHKQ